MADIHNENDQKKPRYAEHAEKIVDDLNGMTVNLSWLKDYDLDMTEGIESYIEYRAYRLDITDEDSPLETAEDMQTYAKGVARPISDVLSVHRKSHHEDENLFPILFFVASLGYEIGVRDASEGRLTSGTMNNISRKRAASDNGHRVMRELYDDIAEI